MPAPGHMPSGGCELHRLGGAQPVQFADWHSVLGQLVEIGLDCGQLFVSDRISSILLQLLQRHWPGHLDLLDWLVAQFIESCQCAIDSYSETVAALESLAPSDLSPRDRRKWCRGKARGKRRTRSARS